VNQRRTSALFSSDMAVLPVQSGFWAASVHYHIASSGISQEEPRAPFSIRERGHWTMVTKVPGNGPSIPERLTISEDRS
jgi:hypothetical protein